MMSLLDNQFSFRSHPVDANYSFERMKLHDQHAIKRAFNMDKRVKNSRTASFALARKK